MFCNLEAEMARLRLSRRKLADCAGIQPKSFSNKMSGKTRFKLNEMESIKGVINAIRAEPHRSLPPLTLDYLFEVFHDEDAS